MFLGRLTLNPRNRGVRRDLGSPTDMHRTLMEAFGAHAATPRREHGTLYRIESPSGGVPLVLVQSRSEPDWSRLPEGYLAEAGWGEDNPAVKPLGPLLANLSDGQQFRFRLLANATRRIKRDAGGSTRVPLRDEAALAAWLQRKQADAGFEVAPTALRIERQPAQRGRRGQNGLVTIEAALFEGVLCVRDPARLRDAIEAGMGPGKAYGCGMLSLARR